MQKLLFAILLLPVFHPLVAQRTEIHFTINGGMLSFRGASVSNNSYIVANNSNTSYYINAPYGPKPGLDAGADITVQRVTKNRWLYGFAAGLELLKQSIPIEFISYPQSAHLVTGKVAVHSQFLDFRPFTGYRFQIEKSKTIDVLASMEVAVGLSYFQHTGTITRIDNGQRIAVDRLHDEVPTDIRAGMQTRLQVKRFSLALGYWLGLTNYYSGYSGLNPQAYSKLFRFGLGYRLNKGK